MVNRFKSIIGGNDLAENFNRVSKFLGKINFIFPTVDNILCQTGETIAVKIGDTTFNVPTGDVTISNVEASSNSGVDFKLSVDGEIPLLSAELKAAGWGAGSNVTNSIFLLVELPTTDYTKVKYAAGSNALTALTSDDVFVYEDKAYMWNLKGVYNDSGIKGGTASFKLIYGPITKTYEFDYTNATLEV